MSKTYFLKRIVAVGKFYNRKAKQFFDFIKLKYRTQNKEVNSFNMSKKIVILIPHADDEWIGCSQIIVHTNDVVLCNLNMPGGDTTELHMRRFEELKLISEKYNSRLLNLEYSNLENELTQVILAEKPELIFVPFYYDWHEEHVKSMQCLCKCLGNIGEKKIKKIRIAMYQVSVPIPNRWINFALPMRKNEFYNKWQTFDTVYKTQVSLPWQRFRYSELINGRLCNNYAAEVFSVLDCKVWCDFLEKELLNPNEKRMIKQNLQDMIAVRNILMTIRP